MIELRFDNIEELKAMHSNAIIDHVKNGMVADAVDALYQNIIKLSGFETYATMRDVEDYEWLKQFVLADPPTLKRWANTEKAKLDFTDFSDIYTKSFSNGTDKYVDTKATYNAYTLFKEMNISVCPYCEDQFINIFDINGKKIRTVEFDHFYPKGKNEYPALAMCFYNLVPACNTCNTKTKGTVRLAANPYSPGIEQQTSLRTDIPLGKNMDNVGVEECTIHFNSKGDMVKNVTVLGLKERYLNIKPDVHDMLSKKQKFSDEKLEENAKIFNTTPENLRRTLFGRPKNEARFKELHTKMKYDLIGY